ncbi:MULTISPECIES: MFS transporter [unclassified Lactobacillus]|uniref:MFS transporter n=1 Tax=unclassified Lactobacillus TaxID=2620435 RepID=UPI000EFA4355|nr:MULTISPECIES: MFS transporter [unclassified Lactobacillus]RMC26000.1 MFS transporter [Lactobacillus sp. ESL0247]RMC29693.1 MFS transporter [Lactobacillus sp. ESL0246]RMC34098.1 MFS transporter [Lactobacillus sp. ESL0245]
MEKNKSYAGVAAAVYSHFAVVGAATLFISQYRQILAQSWNATETQISLVMAMVGLGRIITILFAGAISDKIGRKRTLIIALISDAIFLLGAAFANNIWIAGIAAVFFGVTNSFGDTAGYPALADAFPNKTATMNSFVKAAMQVMQMLFPFCVKLIKNPQITASILVVIILVDVMLTFKTTFASQIKQEKVAINDNDEVNTDKGNQPKLAVDGLMIIALGFTICFTFYIFSLYVPYYGQYVLNESAANANQLVSWYSIASLISVFLTSAMVTKVKRLNLILVYSAITAVGLFFMILNPSQIAGELGALAVGFFTAGGVWQVGLSVLTSYFPQGHGKITSYYSFAPAVVYFVAPLVAAFVLKANATSTLLVFWITAIITIISVILSAILIVRSKQFDIAG